MSLGHSFLHLKSPYLLFLGNETRKPYLKTALGLLHWCPEACAGQMNLAGGTVDLGLPALTVEEAAAQGVRSLLIGTATVGGAMPDNWIEPLSSALCAGLDVVSGLHTRLNNVPELARAAAVSGSRIVDVRVPPANLPVGNGKKRSGLRLITVGTDCALGKKFTALSLARAMESAGFNVDFRATGQTGIMIAGAGIPIDAVVSDFLIGAAETLSPDAAAGHWDVIEGQGSLFHPGYASVSHGLLIGSQPDAFVVCHEAGRDRIEDFEHYPTPSLSECIEKTRKTAAFTNPDVRCVGISINTSSLTAEERDRCLKAAEDETGLPSVDPIATGVGPIVDNLKRIFGLTAELNN